MGVFLAPLKAQVAKLHSHSYYLVYCPLLVTDGHKLHNLEQQILFASTGLYFGVLQNSSNRKWKRQFYNRVKYT